jgi:hypothetical protein
MSGLEFRPVAVFITQVTSVLDNSIVAQRRAEATPQSSLNAQDSQDQ